MGINWNYPTTIWLGKDRVNDIELACAQLKIKNPLFVTDKDLSNLETYTNLITDFSGIALEFFYLTGRPVLFLDVTKKIKRKLKKKEKDLNLIENDMRNIIGKVTKIDDLTDFDISTLYAEEESRKFIESLNYSKSSLNQTVDIINKLIKQKQ